MTPAYKHVQVWTGKNCGSITIYPTYANSCLTITEATPDETKPNLFKGLFESWWNTRPCKYCEKVFTEHGEYTRSCGEHKDNPNLIWKTKYEPMDNLTYTEWAAKERGLV